MNDELFAKKCVAIIQRIESCLCSVSLHQRWGGHEAGIAADYREACVIANELAEAFRLVDDGDDKAFVRPEIENAIKLLTSIERYGPSTWAAPIDAAYFINALELARDGFKHATGFFPVNTPIGSANDEKQKDSIEFLRYTEKLEWKRKLKPNLTKNEYDAALKVFIADFNKKYDDIAGPADFRRSKDRILKKQGAPPLRNPKKVRPKE